MAMFITLWLLLLGAVDPARVKIDITPRSFMQNDTIRLRCTVHRNKDNRYLQYGIKDYAESSIELEGDDEPLDRTRTAFVQHVPCDVGPAYCAVIDAHGKTFIATQDFTVGGCGI